MVVPLRVVQALCLVASTLAPRLALAQETYRVPDELRQPAQLPEGIDARGAQSLGLKDAIQLAARQNLGVVLSREVAAATEQTVRAAWGASFEPSVTAFYGHTSARSPPPVALSVNGNSALSLSTVGDSWNISLNQRLETGTQLALNFTNQRTLYSPGGSLPVVYNAGLNLQITQPVLKGFAFDLAVPRQDVLRARFDTVRAREDVRIALIATVHATADAYWDLVGALKNYEVQHESLKFAEDTLRLTQKQIEAGILAPSDLISAESTQAQRQLGLLIAETAVGNAADTLRHALNMPRDEWTRAILPTDAPEFVDRKLDLATANETALKKRPEIAQGRVDIDKAGLNVRVAKTNRLPELDVGFNYGLVGQQVGYADTAKQIASADLPTWGLTANLSWSPLMLQARATLSSLEYTEGATQTQLEQKRLDLYFELRSDLRALSAAASQVRAAGKFRELAQRTLDAEQRKFLNGTGASGSSNFLIAQRQADVATARGAEVTALIAHQKASTALEAAMGILLEERGVELAVAR